MRRSKIGSTVASPVLALVTAVLVLTATAATAGVITDRWTYQVGDTVYITGDAMQAGETVGVDVSYPDATLAQHHDVVADDNGDFSDTYVIQPNDPPGIYGVTATGATSGNTFTTTFDPAPPGCDITASASNATTTSIDISWTSNCINPSGHTDAQFDIYDSSGTFVAGPFYLNGLPSSGNNTDSYGPETLSGLPCGTSAGYYVQVEWDHVHTPVAQSNAVTAATDACTSSTETTVELGAPTNHVAADLVNGIDYHSTVHDAATVTSAGNIPTGSSVEFDFYADGSCGVGTSDTPTTQTVNLTGGSTSETVYSSETGQLITGSYSYLASFTSGDTTKVANSTADCEPFTVNAPPAVTPTIATEIRDASNGTGTGTGTPHFPLGTVVHDHATLSVSSGDPAEGNVNFKLYNGTCPGTATDTQVGSTDSPALAGTDAGVKDSTTFGPLHAGDYYFLVTYTSNNTAKWNSVTTPTCEPMHIDKADTTITTSISPFVLTGPVHDTSLVSSTNTSGFTFNGTANLVYSFYANGTCTGSVTPDAAVNYPNNSIDHTITTPGAYCFKAQYLGNSDYNGSTSDIEPFTAVPPSAVTDSSLCPFDTDSSRTGSQFNLIYTPDVNAPTYKLNASNPGQFYDNIFYVGGGNVDVNVTIPLPFVTQGAVPIHIYNGVTIGAGGCYLPGTEIANSNKQVTLTSRTLSVHIPSLAGGFAYIAIHLDYGYKGEDNCTKNATTLAASCTTPNSVTIGDNTSYAFSNSLGGSNIVYNENIFKKDPGIGGLVTQGGNPVVGSTVKIYDGSNHLLGTVTTDSDGWYMWAYKYTGKAATFVVKNGTSSQNVTLKSNGYLIVNFTY